MYSILILKLSQFAKQATHNNSCKCKQHKSEHVWKHSQNNWDKKMHVFIYCNIMKY